MKCLPLLCFALLMAAIATQAQQSQRIKLVDIVAAHEKEEEQKIQNSKSLQKTTGANENHEKSDNHFQRWLWLAKQHTDKNGYVVPHAQAWQILQQHSTINAAKKTSATQADWTYIGPNVNTNLYYLSYQQADGEGRVNTIGYHPTDKNTFWVGTSSAGAWKTTNFGTTWTCMTDNLPNVIPISDIDMNPLNPNTVYLCTGDKETMLNAAGKVTTSLAYGLNGVGLLKTKDGGATWDTTGFTFAVTDGVGTNTLVINPKDTNTLIMATSTGLYKSKNGAASWVNVSPPIPDPNVTYVNFWDVVYHPADTNILYATVYGKYLTSDFSAILRSADGGVNWDFIKIITKVVRASIAVSKSSPNIVKVLTAYGKGDLLLEEGIYSSNDAGLNFTKLHNPADCRQSLTGFYLPGVSNCNAGGQSHYNLSICIDPADSNHVLIGGVMSIEFFDGGNMNWDYLNWWQNFVSSSYPQSPYPLIHSDKHFLGYHPLDTSYLMECNDGGIFYRRNGVWKDITPGLGITQFYRNGVSNDGKFVLGGAQDNGSHYMTKNMTQCIGGGDGMECQVDFVDSNIIYASSQQGNISRYDRRTALVDSNVKDIKPTTNLGSWTTPFILNPLNHDNIIMGFDVIYSSLNRGNNWIPISPSFGTNISRLAMSPQHPSVLYAVEEYRAGGDNRNIHFTTNFGLNWDAVKSPYPEKIITDIKADPKNSYHFWITFGGFGNTNKVAEYAVGPGWKSISTGLPNVPVYCIEADSSDGTLYIGTYDGIYYLPKDALQWELYNTNLPHVPTTDIGISYVSGQLVAATFGRGMWSSPKYIRDLGIYKGVPYGYKQLTVYPNPAADKFTVVSDINQFNDNNVTAQMIDVKGQIVWQQQTAFKGNALQISNLQLPNGVYILHLSNAAGADAKARIVITR